MEIEKTKDPEENLSNLKLISLRDFVAGGKPFSGIEDYRRESELVEILRFSGPDDIFRILDMGYSYEELGKAYERLKEEPEESSAMRQARAWSQLSGKVVGAEDPEQR